MGTYFLEAARENDASWFNRARWRFV